MGFFSIDSEHPFETMARWGLGAYGIWTFIGILCMIIVLIIGVVMYSTQPSTSGMKSGCCGNKKQS